jgi:hypothetical protein
MFKSLSLRELMDIPLPNRTAQKRLLFRPDLQDVEHVYDLLNEQVFNNVLIRPNIKLGKCREYWGMCYGEDKPYENGTYCRIKLSDKWYSVQWMVTMLAHEMSHQFQWDVYSHGRTNRVMSHGPSFYRYQQRLYRHNISVKTTYSSGMWFRTQDMFKS